MERQTITQHKPLRRASGGPDQRPLPTDPHAPLAPAQDPPHSFCTPAHAKTSSVALAGFLGLDPNADALEVNQAAQAEKLFAWKPGAQDPRCMNSAWRGADAQRKQGFTSQMPQLFPVLQPRLQQVPAVMFVPLGLSSLNAARIRSLQAACAHLLETFGPDALKKTHLYFVGGRTLMKEECLPLDQVMGAGLAFFCDARWAELDADTKSAFLRDFAETQAKSLGETGLQLPAQDRPLREKDSARHIWMNAPGLASLRDSIPPDHVHFHESTRPVPGKDNTHGNALLGMDKCLSHKTLTPAQAGLVLVCSDPYCLPRVEASFKGFFEPWGWEVVGFSTSLSGDQPDQLDRAHSVCCTLGLREIACLHNERQQARQNPGSWYDSEDLQKRFSLSH